MLSWLSLLRRLRWLFRGQRGSARAKNGFPAGTANATIQSPPIESAPPVEPRSPVLSPEEIVARQRLIQAAYFTLGMNKKDKAGQLKHWLRSHAEQ